MRFMVILGLAFLCSACTMSTRYYDLPYRAARTSPNAPPEYKQGWKDGCETGISMYGNTFHKSIYSFKQDPVLMKNKTYAKVWSDAVWYCRSYMNRSLAGDSFSGSGLSPISTTDLGFKASGRLRDFPTVSKGGWGFWGQPDDGLGLPWFQGFDPIPSWGENAKSNTDWLGRTKEYQWGYPGN